MNFSGFCKLRHLGENWYVELEQSNLVDDIKFVVRNSNYLKKARAYNGGNVVNMVMNTIM